MKDNSPAVTIPGGVYYFTGMDVGKNCTVTFTGPTTIYLNGGGSFDGTIAHSSYKPYLLTIKAKGGIHIEDGATYAYIYNPEGSVHHHKLGQSFGSVITNLLCFRQTAQGHYDEAGGPGGNIVSVK